MQYFDYIIGIIYDSIEKFVKSFSVVSGKATLRVLYFGLFYLFLSIISKVLDIFVFIDIKSAVLAVVYLFVVNCISNIQYKDISKFKALLKGDYDNSDEQG